MSSRRHGLHTDDELAAFVEATYGVLMADRCADIFRLDPENETGFAASIRRSLQRESLTAVQNGRWKRGE